MGEKSKQLVTGSLAKKPLKLNNGRARGKKSNDKERKGGRLKCVGDRSVHTKKEMKDLGTIRKK